MATSSTRMLVRVSSVPDASVNMVVEVGICTTAAPSLTWVARYVGAVRVNPVFWDKFRCPWVRDWWEPALLGGRFMDALVRGGRLFSSGNNCIDVYPPRDNSTAAGGPELGMCRPC